MIHPYMMGPRKIVLGCASKTLKPNQNISLQTSANFAFFAFQNNFETQQNYFVALAFLEF